MIIENNKDLKKFLKEYKSKDSIIIPISSDERKHPLDTDVCLLYVHTFDEEYILPLRHNECLNIDMPNLESKTKKYTIDKKRLLHFLNFLQFLAQYVHKLRNPSLQQMHVNLLCGKKHVHLHMEHFL